MLGTDMTLLMMLHTLHSMMVPGGRAAPLTSSLTPPRLSQYFQRLSIARLSLPPPGHSAGPRCWLPTRPGPAVTKAYDGAAR